MINHLRHKVIDFINSKNNYPILAGLASGLYAISYYYDKNFNLVNSWIQFSFFLFFFLIVPVFTIASILYLSNKIKKLTPYKSYVISILNLCFFAFFIVIITRGYNLKLILIFVSLSLILGIVLRKHLNKIIVFQFLLAVIVGVKLVPDLYRAINYSKNWMEQPDLIENVKFKKHPNIYLIQPDGYVSFSELKKQKYNFDNSEFENFLTTKGFKLYDDFRSNYYNTLTSNSSLFAMRHHYFNRPKKPNVESYYDREVITGDNPVLRIFKNNGYKTSLLLEKPYLLLNRPELKYDYCNINYNTLNYLDHGSTIMTNLENDLMTAISKNAKSNNFYFIAKTKPSHIASHRNKSLGKEKEKENYIRELIQANNWLENIINEINKIDHSAIVMILADHGSYVGFDYTHQRSKRQTENPDLITSIYASALAIKWPNNVNGYDSNLKTSVNMFRVLFSYLSEDANYLNHLQEDISLCIISQNAPFGVYEVIDNEGNIVFNIRE